MFWRRLKHKKGDWIISCPFFILICYDEKSWSSCFFKSAMTPLSISLNSFTIALAQQQFKMFDQLANWKAIWASLSRAIWLFFCSKVIQCYQQPAIHWRVAPQHCSSPFYRAAVKSNEIFKIHVIGIEFIYNCGKGDSGFLQCQQKQHFGVCFQTPYVVKI